MNKYPVTSTRGNEYYVEVNESRIYANHYEIGIYTKSKGWFNRDIYTLVNEGFMGRVPLYNAEAYGFDIIKIVSTIIENIEDELSQNKLHKEHLDTARNNFSEWDGKIIKEDNDDEC